MNKNQQILNALEREDWKPKEDTMLGNVVGGFLVIAIGTTIINEVSKR